jgi:hypothetical protein
MKRLLPVAAMIGLVSLAACDPLDPLKRDYYWHPANVNQSNIAAMAANPADLSRGRDSRSGPSITQADAVNRVLTGRQTPLIMQTVGATGGVSSTGASGTSNGTGGGS